ncbi:hypothetical protein [Streptomyces halobius]
MESTSHIERELGVILSVDIDVDLTPRILPDLVNGSVAQAG